MSSEAPAPQGHSASLLGPLCVPWEVCVFQALTWRRAERVLEALAMRP